MQCNFFGTSIQLWDFEDELKTCLSETFLCPLMLQTYYPSIALAWVPTTLSFHRLHPCCSMVCILAFRGLCNSVFFSDHFYFAFLHSFEQQFYFLYCYVFAWLWCCPARQLCINYSSLNHIGWLKINSIPITQSCSKISRKSNRQSTLLCSLS